ncbi:hypothetical protein [Celerinatantimonas diazotrophica]|uniref:DNA-directed DNA polymerase n=1 Tax=Celerinatantimonas diazotrophica TaxID=412034 RepID=A0A4R1JAH8_9GAMM|nr:hypothetical protein [Celerinatantimonas diazotrophica]TCK47642.1 DNA polymerase-3 subunit delta' [Celerinatantimonas diazotrophica]CAG9296735.1 hypothetical protein CEDIAZO_01892 [Celerinatantimonas diazotrophica]
MITSLPPWQERLVEQLSAQFANHRLAQTLLFDYEKGAAVETLSNYLVRLILCQSHTAKYTPCGHCHSCHMLESESHSDFYSLAPKGQSIGVDDVRLLQDWSVQKPTHGHGKVALIEQSHKLTPSAANALLKMLEEPKENTYFILLKPLQSSLLTTIISRAQRWVIHSPSPTQALDLLQQWYPDIHLERLQLALHWLDGPTECAEFFNNNGEDELSKFTQAVEGLNQHDIDPIAQQLEKSPDKLSWLGQIIIDSLQNHFHKRDHICPLLTQLTQNQLIDAWQMFVQLREKLAQHPALNFSLQVYPLLSYLNQPESNRAD